MVAGRIRTRAGRPIAVSGRPMLIHTFHAMPLPRTRRAVPWPREVAFRKTWSWHGTGAAWARHGRGMGAARARHGRGMECVNQTRPHCVNQIGKTQSKHFLARHGWETPWAQQGNGMVCVN
jgi:hypothetical protein